MAAGDVKVSLTTNRSFKGASFDGVDDYVEIPHNASQLGANLSNGFTISAWINPKSAGENTAGRILDKSTNWQGNDGFAYGFDGVANLMMYTNIGTKAWSANFNLRTWSHVLVTVTSAQLATHYINKVVSGTPTDLVQPISAITTTNALRIGNRSGATDVTFDGSIRSVKMWNRVLTADEIAADYAGGEISNGQILNAPLQTDYNDKSYYALTGTNSGTYFTINDDAISAAVKAQRVGANDKWMCYAGKGGQVGTVEIEA